MSILDALGKELLLFDGAMGTMLLQAGLKPGEPPDIWCITHPDIVRNIHCAYLKAGANILTTNTFGCTAKKLEGTGHTPADVARAAVQCAKEAIALEKSAAPRFIALDVGPIGKLLKPLGDLDFEDAVSLFSTSIAAGEQAGADLVLVETMSDTYELKAAILAAKEHSKLPVFATVTLDINGRLLTGGDVRAVVVLLEGLRVDALGINCGLGPAEMLPFLKEIRSISSLPLILTPNAGIPHEEDGRTVYHVEPEPFASLMAQAVHAGAQVLGGCCGTTPTHIAAVYEACKDIPLAPITKKEHTAISSYSRAVFFDNGTVIIGERINPTGKPLLKQALREGDYDYILRQGIAQQECGAHVLDVNAGLPEIDEAETLKALTEQLQSVIDLPLQLDSASPEALKRAMRYYNGKPMINSVNGKRESMEAVFPLVAKYGGLLVALTLDESGIPETADGRVAVAQNIIKCAAEYGIEKKDIIVDTLTMTISAGQDNANVTLETLRRVKEELQVKTSLGVSNVSFGLPARQKLNATFFMMAMAAGLDAAIINPDAESMMHAYYSAQALRGFDPQCAAYITRFSAERVSQADAPTVPGGLTLAQAVRQGLKQQAVQLAKAALATNAPLDVIDENLVPALNDVGEAFEKGLLFLPQLLMSADAAKAAFEVIRASMGADGAKSKGCVVLATVEGDVHDIGKNIVRALLENYQFQVIDLGKDVPPEAVLEAAREHGVRLVGLSALMTTTVQSMKRTVALLKEQLPECRVMVGGAVLSKRYADDMGADQYVRDAMASVHYAQVVYGE